MSIKLGRDLQPGDVVVDRDIDPGDPDVFTIETIGAPRQTDGKRVAFVVGDKIPVYFGSDEEIEVQEGS